MFAKPATLFHKTAVKKSDQKVSDQTVIQEKNTKVKRRSRKR
jgi:hypothetical protein